MIIRAAPKTWTQSELKWRKLDSNLNWLYPSINQTNCYYFQSFKETSKHNISITKSIETSKLNNFTRLSILLKISLTSLVLASSVTYLSFQ